MNIADLIAWCEANDVDPTDPTARKQYEAAHTPSGGNKRSYQARTFTLYALGQTEDGAQVFLKASGVPTRSKADVSAVLRFKLENDHGAVGSVELAERAE